MKIEIIAFTNLGFELGKKLSKSLSAIGHSCGVACTHDNERLNVRMWTQKVFDTSEALVFIGAAGIAVRSIAPYIKSKLTDPAVIVIDEQAQFVIPLLSGHIGGANEIAGTISELISSRLVLTTATDINKVFAIDTWAKKNGFKILNPEAIKRISASLLSGCAIKLRSEFPVVGGLPKGIELCEDKDYDVLISIKNKGKQNALRLVPCFLSVGIGCKKETSEQAISETFEMALAKGSISRLAVKEMCSIDLKAKEHGILDFCSKHNFLFRTFSAKVLLEQYGNFTPSAFVQSITGVDNVCERSAVAGCGGKLLTKKKANNGVTIAIACPEIIVNFKECL